MVETFFSRAFLIGLCVATIRLAVPILLASLGEVFAQRSGVLNLGVEGMMLIGAFVGFAGAFHTGNVWIGFLIGMIAGALMGLLMAFMAVTLQADQVITGIMIVLIAGGLVTFFQSRVFGTSQYIPPKTAGLQTIPIPLFSQLPVVGEVLFQQNLLVYLAWLTVPLLATVLSRTTWGLKIRAVGENPRAADCLGVNVFVTRYLCVIFGGAMAGLGGAFLPLGYLGTFSENISGGRGWIAIALVIFGNWKPYRVLAGALLFGGVNALQLRLQALGANLPFQFMLMLPYLLTIIALVMVTRKASGPASLCVPYRRE